MPLSIKDLWTLELTTADPIDAGSVQTVLQKHNIHGEIEQNSDTCIVVTLRNITYSTIHDTQELLREMGEVRKLDTTTI